MRSSDDTVIGFVGLGNMGVPMCKNLADAGFAVIAYDTDQAAGQRADAAHDAITVVTSLEELAGKARHIVLMVPDSGVVARVVCGDSGYSDLTVGNDGLSRFIEPGSIIADMSSSFPPATVALGEKLQEANITLIDAPVSGGVRKAVTAELAIMAGGNTAAIDAFANAFSAMGNVFRTGGLGSGHATKALNNYLSASSLIATAEALVIGEAFGLDPAAMNAVFKNSTGRSNTTDVKVDAYFLTENFASGFALKLLEKDVGMARRMSEELGLDASYLQRASALLHDGMDALEPGIDHTAMYAFLKESLRKSGQ